MKFLTTVLLSAVAFVAAGATVGVAASTLLRSMAWQNTFGIAVAVAAVAAVSAFFAVGVKLQNRA